MVVWAGVMCNVVEKSNNLGFRPDPTQNGLYSQGLEILDLESRGIILPMYGKQRH